MQHRTSKFKTLAFAVATPNLVTNALASENRDVEILTPQAEIVLERDSDPLVLAQNNRLQQKQTVTPAQARSAVRAELAKMSTAQKAALGRSQVEIEKLAVEPAALTKCAGNITHGVGCMDPATGGYTCCILTLGAPTFPD